ncbi:MAG: histidine kinase [Flavobacteriaceae bacterium]|nr:histidine kinase [Flavobacteriaceae bacterium]
MRRLFIHHPLFRLLSPVFSGVIIYLLILLINNDVVQLQEQFLGQELYICVGLSFIIQEFARFSLWIFGKLPKHSNPVVMTIVQLVVIMLITICLVTFSIGVYFENVLGYMPNSEELWLFNSIFCVITGIYILLHISHQYLYKVNTKKLKNEELQKELIEEDFEQFKKGINPDLLFESLESIIIMVQKNPNQVDNVIDHLAEVYRYILSRKKRQLVMYSEERQVLDALLKLFNILPYRTLIFKDKVNSDFLMVPGTLLEITENIIKTTIVDLNYPLEVVLSENIEYLEISYSLNDKITSSFALSKLEATKNQYDFYSTQKIKCTSSNNKRIINVPKLTTV